MTTQKVPVSTLKPGDKIMPPEREVRLWMRQHVIDNGLTDAALIMTVVAVEPYDTDKRGEWWRVTAEHNAKWLQGRERAVWKFLARP